MTSIVEDFHLVLRRDLEGLQREVEAYPDDETLWMTRAGVTNAGGNLAWHVAGNIQHFIGHMLGGVPYQRDREAEFGRRSGSRGEVVAELRRAAAVVEQVLPRLTEARLAAPFELHPGEVTSTQRLLLHLCVHTTFHLGQLGYLRRLLTGDSRSTNPISSRRLASPSS